jgi:hypothetical protein
MSDNLVANSSGTTLAGDADMLTTHARNPIYIYGSDMSSNDKFRLEVKITYEYIPCTDFKDWVDTGRIRATINEQREITDITNKNPEM